jgi:hypothetical protein
MISMHSMVFIANLYFTYVRCQVFFIMEVMGLLVLALKLNFLSSHYHLCYQPLSYH